jgi:Domain of unknown function (DUF1844)
MAQKRREEAEFKVSDRRQFTTDGELRSDSTEEQGPPSTVATATAVSPEPLAAAANTVATAAESTARLVTPPEVAPPASVPAGESDIPEPPSVSEQNAQHDAYKQSSRDLDARVELSGHSAKELEMSFERFMASLYMTAMMQLGLMHEQGGQPGVDLIGARQTIDTLGMISEKTKGNLTPKEQGFLQNCLYELRMAYVEVTNAIARGPQTPGPGKGIAG